MNFNELENYLSSLPDKILDDAAEIVAETATSYYKERFREKAFDGNPSAPAERVTPDRQRKPAQQYPAGIRRA